MTISELFQNLNLDTANKPFLHSLIAGDVVNPGMPAGNNS